jgi:hypothetical protein
MKKITKKAVREFLKSKLSSDARWALRALEVVYSNQTADEQATQCTRTLNGEGFTGIDGEILSSFAEQYERRRSLSHKQMALLFKKMPKYWGQVLEVSDSEKLKMCMEKETV